MTQSGSWDLLNPPELHWMSNAKSKPFKAYAGLYWYSGMGSGYLYLPDGRVLWGSPSEAQEECSKANVKYEFRDSFAYYVSTYLGD